MPNPNCDHYWLVRRGGTCPHCKEVFRGQMQPGSYEEPKKPEEAKTNAPEAS